LGVYHVYRSASGDLTNNLIVPQLFAHPSLKMDAEAGDARVAAKLVTLDTPVTVQGLTANEQFKIYTFTAPLPIIPHEELILLRAEAEILTNDLDGALTDINFVRTHSGQLAPLTAFASAADAKTALLYERRYSLMLEGHRWIDVRRLGNLQDLPADGGM